MNMCTPAIPRSPTFAISEPTAPDFTIADASEERASSSQAHAQFTATRASPGTSGIATPSNGYFTSARTMRGVQSRPTARMTNAAARTVEGALARCSDTMELAR